MPDSLKDTISHAVKPAVDYAKNLYAQGKALVQPIDKGTAQTLADKAKQVGDLKGTRQPPVQNQPAAQPNSYKKGGKVRKTGVAKVHKGERVLTKKQTKKFDKKGGLSKVLGGK
jgi:hypothetical protein